MKKFKKILGVMGLLFVTTLILGACGKDAKEQYLNQWDKMTDSNNSSMSFEMKFTDFKFSKDSEANAYTSMAATQLKDMSFYGEVKSDEKAKAFDISINAKLMGQELPLHVIANEEKQYLSTDFVGSALDLAESFGMDLPFDATDFTEMKGKFIDISEMADTMDVDVEKKVDAKAQENVLAFGEAYGKEVKAYFKGIDKKEFIKDKDEISYTLTKSDLVALIKLSGKVADSDKKFAEMKDMSKLEDIFDIYKKCDVKITLNTKNNDAKYEFDIKLKEGEGSGLEGLKFELSVSYKDEKPEIKMPTRKNIITKSELEDIFKNVTPNPSSYNEDYDDDDEYDAALEMTDKELEDLIQVTIEDIDGGADKKVILATYKEMLDEEQYKKVEAALKQY